MATWYANYVPLPTAALLLFQVHNKTLQPILHFKLGTTSLTCQPLAACQLLLVQSLSYLKTQLKFHLHNNLPICLKFSHQIQPNTLKLQAYTEKGRINHYLMHTSLWIIKESVEIEQIAYHCDYRFAPKLKYSVVEAFTYVVQDNVTLAITFEHTPSL